MPINYFTTDQLIQIYEASGRSLNADMLQSTAKDLYPDVLESNGRAPIFVLDRSFKGFLVEGEYKRAKHTISSRLVNAIGIMDDGTPISYDK